VHDVACPHPCEGPLVIIPLLDPVPPSGLPLEPLPDPELLEPLELLALPPLEPELLDVAPELLPFGVTPPLLLVLPLLPLLLPLLEPVGWALFIIEVDVPLELPLVSTGGGPNVPLLLGVDEVQPKIETATLAAAPRVMEWRFFISASRTVWTLGGWDLPRFAVAPR